MHLEESGRLTYGNGGDVLVTGAAGGLGSIAVAILANRGYRVVASSRRAATHGDYLQSLGAAEVIEGLVEEGAKLRPLDKQRWDGVVDSVGGTTLATAVAQLKYNGAVASTGVAGGGEVATTVYPFILRGVRLLGVDSTLPWAVCGYHDFQQDDPDASNDWAAAAVAHRAERLRIWDALERDLPAETVDKINTATVGLSELPAQAGTILSGNTTGRVVVDVSR
mmetsp:Transcript_34594/g.80180  ORF Transcript_34594/g.80180 Transcript_34594/m.80180 type:complete len:223 (-) Transcript_34594:116-784(-)